MGNQRLFPVPEAPADIQQRRDIETHEQAQQDYAQAQQATAERGAIQEARDIETREQEGAALAARQQIIERRQDEEVAMHLAEAAEAQRAAELASAREEAREAAAKKQMVTSLTSGQVPFFPKWLPEMIDSEAPSVEPVMTPQHEAGLRKVKMKLMVNDMISNDPTLSAYAPGEVIDAVNKISAMAPSLSTNGPLMKSLVSRFLQKGDLDPSEFAQIMDLELKQRNL